MLAPTNCFLDQELCLFVCLQPVKKLHRAPSSLLCIFPGRHTILILQYSNAYKVPVCWVNECNIPEQDGSLTGHVGPTVIWSFSNIPVMLRQKTKVPTLNIKQMEVKLLFMLHFVKQSSVSIWWREKHKYRVWHCCSGKMKTIFGKMRWLTGHHCLQKVYKCIYWSISTFHPLNSIILRY